MKTAIKRVLIANRGEIAVRIIRALRDLELQSVVVYSDADESSMHVKMADFAVRLNGVTPADTYLNIPALLAAAKTTEADAVHPGYGFLSESSQFAKEVTSAGMEFIGPSVESMELLGNKIEARKLMIENNIPVVPGIEKPLQTVEELRSAISEIGYPVILKAAAGGGGRGMRIVRKDEELEPSLTGCQREALAYFGNPDVFCERFVENPRHIEFQVLFDGHGNGVHLFERDCSVQRRHQKLFEEAPSTYLTHDQRTKLGEFAVRAAKLANYEGVGTIEFICESPEKAYFMEMNTRIQVEHPVTESITGIDLIVEQIKVAQGQKLTIKQDDLKIQGWSLEARINAEDPLRDFLPSPGRIKQLRFPSGPHVRVESHLYSGYEIPAAYDSMISKIIVWGQTRDEAIRRMRRALCEVEIEGVPTTTRFQEALLRNESFLSGDFNTDLVPSQWEQLTESMQYHSESNENDTQAALLAVVGVLTAEQESSGKLKNAADNQKWTERSRQEAVNIH